MENLEKEFERTEKDEPRKAAELAYVIAMIAKDEKNEAKALKYGRASVRLFESLNTETLKACVAMHTVVNGVALPELIHADVVKSRLCPLEV